MKEKIFTKNFWLSFIALCCCAMVMYMLSSTITEYASEFTDAAVLAGMVSGMYAFAGMMSRMASNGILKRFGWKKFGVCAALLHFVACCLYFFPSNIGSLIILRFIHGLGFGAINNIILTVGMSILPKSRYAEASGYFSLPSIMAIALGPYVGGLIKDNLGSAGCFVAAALLCFGAVICTLMLDVSDETVGVGKAVQATVEKPKGLNCLLEVSAIPLCLCLTLLVLGFTSVVSFYREYAVQTGLETVFSYFFIIYAIVLLCIRTFIGRAQDKFGDNYICYASIVFQAIGLFLIAWRPCTATVIICSLCFVLGYGTLQPCINAIVTGHAPGHRRSYAVTSVFLFMDFGLGIGPMIMGGVSDIFGGHRAMYYAAAVLAVLALPLYHFVWGRRGDTAVRVNGKPREVKSK